MSFRLHYPHGYSAPFAPCHSYCFFHASVTNCGMSGQVISCGGSDRRRRGRIGAEWERSFVISNGLFWSLKRSPFRHIYFHGRRDRTHVGTAMNCASRLSRESDRITLYLVHHPFALEKKVNILLDFWTFWNCLSFWDPHRGMVMFMLAPHERECVNFAFQPSSPILCICSRSRFQLSSSGL